MPPKRNSKKEPDNYNTELKLLITKLNKDTENVSKLQETFMDTFNELKNFSANSIGQIDNEIEKKQEECYNMIQQLNREYDEKEYELSKNYERKEYELTTSYKYKKSQLEKEFSNDELEKAESICTNNKKVVIDQEEYNNLNKEISSLKEIHETLDKTLKEKYEKQLNKDLKTKDLENELKCAEMKANIEQQRKEIITLNETISTLKTEITEQRNLTKSVAESTQKAVTQNFSSK